MANNIQSSPIFLDTVNAAISIGRNFGLFRSVEWVGGGTIAASDRAYLTDASGNVLCDWTYDGADKNYSKEWGGEGAPFDGPLNLQALTHGYILLYRA